MAREYADILNGTFGDEDVNRQSNNLSVIFGSGIRLADEANTRTQRRIVVYPCKADAADAETAQGLMCALAWALNSLDGVVVMPLLVDAPSATWEPNNSAFTPDDVQLDALGEDTVITASLERNTASGYVLSLSAVSDVEGSDDVSVDVTGDSFVVLLNGVINAVPTFATMLGGTPDMSSSVPEVRAPDAAVREWLHGAFAWYRAALLTAANEEFYDQDFAQIRDRTLLELSEAATTWLLVQSIALMSVWYETDTQDAELIIDMAKSLKAWQAGAPALSRALIEMRETRLAIETLETAVEEAPEQVRNWLVLSRLYAAVQRADLMLEVLQRGIELHPEDAPLLMLYGETLLTYAEQGLMVQQTILAGEGESTENEAIAAFRAAVRLTADEQRAMASIHLITALERAESPDLWQAFEELAVSDAKGIYIEHAINVISAEDDLEQALPALEKASIQHPLSGQVWRNLAYVQYLAGHMDTAATSIARALQYADSDTTRGEYELLALYAQDATIEGQLAEIADIVSAGYDVSERHLELLEWIVSEAPHYGEGYLLLARAYAADGESDTALEVLLDAEKQTGGSADIVAAIVDLLMESGEETVALEYITKGIENYPRHIPLLARAAQVTHALGDDDGARAFLRQAHNIAPYHKELLRVTQELMNADDED